MLSILRKNILVLKHEQGKCDTEMYVHVKTWFNTEKFIYIFAKEIHSELYILITFTDTIFHYLSVNKYLSTTEDSSYRLVKQK